MKTHPRIVVVAVLAVMLAFSAPQAFGSWTCQLAQNPFLISGGVYDGKIEYFFEGA